MRLLAFGLLVAAVSASSLGSELRARGQHAHKYKSCAHAPVKTTTTTVQTVTTGSVTVSVTVGTSMVTETATVTVKCGAPGLLPRGEAEIKKRGGKAHQTKSKCTPSTTTKTVGSTTTSVLTETVSVVLTLTSTSTVSSATVPASFYVYATGLAQYAKIEYDNQDSPSAFTELTTATADLYSVTEEGYLQTDTGSMGYFGEQDDSEDPNGPIFFDTLEDLTDSGYKRITCTVGDAGDGTCPLTCTTAVTGGSVQSYDDDLDEWYIGSSSAGTAFTPLVVDSSIL